MNKEELMEKIESLAKEKRSIADAYLNPESNVEELDKRSAEVTKELEQRKMELAQLDMPKGKNEEVRSALFDASEWRKLATGEKRSLTIGDTGSINQIKTLFKEIAETDDILNKASFYYGKDAATNIPVLSALGDPSDYAEGTDSVATDSDAAVTVTEIQPKAYARVLPISAEMLTMGTVNLEAELPGIFAKAFRKVMHNGMLQGAGTTKKMKGIWVSAAANTNGVTSLTSGQTALKISDVAGLALKVASKDESYEIVMNPATYQLLIADSTDGEDVKVYKEGLIRDKSIEGVKVRLDAQAPSATTAGSVLAVAVPLDRYAIGVAGQMEIEPIKVKGDTNTYYQATMFFSGKQVSDTDLYSLAVHA